MSIVHVMDHPLIQHKLSLMRDQETGPKEFRELLNEISMLMAYEVTRDLPLKTIEIETPDLPRAQTPGDRRQEAGHRADSARRFGYGGRHYEPCSAAKVGHIGLYRDPNTPLSRWNTTASFRPMRRSAKFCWSIRCWRPAALPPRRSASLKKRGCKNIKLVNLIAAPEGVARVQADHPDVDIYVAGMDEKLNDHGYIIPGLGDAGDRLFGTK